MTRKLIIEHGDKTYHGQVGTITSTTLGYQDIGIMTAYLNVEWPGGGVGVGGFVLDTPGGTGEFDRVGTAFGLDHLIWIMRTVGVDTWEKLVGKQVIVLFEGESTWGAQSRGIAHITDEHQVLVFTEHAQMWKERQNA